MPGCRSASSGGRGASGTVGDRIRGLGVSGRWGGAGPGGPIPYGGGGGSNTEHRTIYRYIHIYIYMKKSLQHLHEWHPFLNLIGLACVRANTFCLLPPRTKNLTRYRFAGNETIAQPLRHQESNQPNPDSEHHPLLVVVVSDPVLCLCHLTKQR